MARATLRQDQLRWRAGQLVGDFLDWPAVLRPERAAFDVDGAVSNTISRIKIDDDEADRQSIIPMMWALRRSRRQA